MSKLPSRYEIRPLGPEHAQWAAAIVAHSNVFCSGVFSVIYPEEKTKRFNALMQGASYLLNHQIDSGLSYGVFDNEFAFKRPESAAQSGGGKFYWDPQDNSVTGDELLAAMDFPLVSVALSYDGFDPLDLNKLGELIASLPVYVVINHGLDSLDPRPADSWRKPAGRNMLLMRNGTSTRRDYEGKGLMGTLARYVMRMAADKGFKMSNIECLNDRVTHVWANPPSPFRGEVVASLEAAEYETKDEKGVVVKPFYPAKQTITRVVTVFADS